MPKRDTIQKYEMPPANVRARQDNREVGAPVGTAAALEGYNADAFPRKAEDATITGAWAVENLRGELKGAVMSADVLNAVGGTLIIAKAAGVLAQQMVIGDDNNDWAMMIIDPPGGGFLFANSDICRIKGENTGGTVTDTWFTVSSRVDLGDGTQLYICSWNYGDEGDTVRAGSLVVDYGASGQGLLTLSADETNAPFYSVQTHAGSPWTTLTTRARMGNMNGSFGVAAAFYGIGAGDYANGNYLLYETSRGFVLKAGDNAVTMDSDGITLIAPESLDVEHYIKWIDSPTTTTQAQIGSNHLGALEVYSLGNQSYLPGGSLMVTIGTTGIDLENDGTFTAQNIVIVERTAEPAKPAEGKAVLWMTNGTGIGDDGDVIIGVTAGGSSKYTIIHDHSTATAWS